jgi:hypothetical protein
MYEEELRAMVRESIARHRGSETIVQPFADATRMQSHPAFARLPLVRGGDDDGNCVIEPAVRCNHCGYCQSYGH